jgi:hypothetical protein
MSSEEIPRDVIPTGMTADALRQLNTIVGKNITVQEPGEIIEDVNGVPIGVTESTTMTAMLGEPVVTAAEVQAAGLTPEDLPNLNIVEKE